MHETTGNRQTRRRIPVSAPMSDQERDVIDQAARMRDESRSQYIRRVVVREAKADVRKAERAQKAAAAAA